MAETGVIGGGDVAAQSVPDGTVQITAGNVVYEGAQGITGATSTFDLLGANPADPVYPRWDYIAFDASYIVSQIVGDLDTLGITPFYQGAFAGIRVWPGATAINDIDIRDLKNPLQAGYYFHF